MIPGWRCKTFAEHVPLVRVDLKSSPSHYASQISVHAWTVYFLSMFYLEELLMLKRVHSNVTHLLAVRMTANLICDLG